MHMILGLALLDSQALKPVVTLSMHSNLLTGYAVTEPA